LVNISRDANEKEQFRKAALEALFVGDKDNIVQYASPILSDKSATPQLQIMAVQMTIDARQSMAHREKSTEEYDLLIKNITEDKNRDHELQKIALEYLQSMGLKQ